MPVNELWGSKMAEGLWQCGFGN